MEEPDKIRIRGLNDKDDKAFSPFWVERIRKAQVELQFLLDRGYPAKSAATFICNHHQLSVRQMLALTRTTSSTKHLAIRAEKSLDANDMRGQTMHIDGLNLIITLEVALSDGMLFVGQDGCIRDLAELRGTYRVIPQTETAIGMIRDTLEKLQVSEVSFYLDAPVSNSGRLKTKIYDIEWHIPVNVNIVRNPDTNLKKLSHVVSGDSIILDECISWFNLVAYIFRDSMEFKHLNRLIELNTGNSQ